MRPVTRDLDIQQGRGFGKGLLKRFSVWLMNTYKRRRGKLGPGRVCRRPRTRHAFEAASGTAVSYANGQRRAGDLTEVWADAARARNELGWSADRTVAEMCEDTWRWQSMNPDGYR